MTHSLIDAMRAQIKATQMPQRQRRLSSRCCVSAGAAGLAGTIVVLVLTLSAADAPPPAFAASLSQGGRTVTITLREYSALGQLNARLTALHTRIRAVPVVHGCHAPVHAVSNGEVIPGPAQTLEAHTLGGSPMLGKMVSETLSVDTIPGRTYVIAESRSGLLEEDSVVVGPAPACVGDIPAANPYAMSG